MFMFNLNLLVKNIAKTIFFDEEHTISLEGITTSLKSPTFFYKTFVKNGLNKTSIIIIEIRFLTAK